MCTQRFHLFVNEVRETKLEIQLDSEKPRTIQRFFYFFSQTHKSQVSLVVVNRSNQTENSNQTTVVELLIPQIAWIILAK